MVSLTCSRTDKCTEYQMNFFTKKWKSWKLPRNLVTFGHYEVFYDKAGLMGEPKNWSSKWIPDLVIEISVPHVRQTFLGAKSRFLHVIHSWSFFPVWTLRWLTIEVHWQGCSVNVWDENLNTRILSCLSLQSSLQRVLASWQRPKLETLLSYVTQLWFPVLWLHFFLWWVCDSRTFNSIRGCDSKWNYAEHPVAHRRNLRGKVINNQAWHFL